jgi:hypothetical protein
MTLKSKQHGDYSLTLQIRTIDVKGTQNLDVSQPANATTMGGEKVSQQSRRCFGVFINGIYL